MYGQISKENNCNTEIGKFIPPTLTKNYDVYIVLKPKEHVNEIEDRPLIDFETTCNANKGDNSDNTTSTSMRTRMECFGSSTFISNDKPPNSIANCSRDLLDLYENISITPVNFEHKSRISYSDELLKPLQVVEKVNTNFKEINVPTENYANSKLIDIDENNDTKNTSLIANDCEERLFGKPKTLIPNLKLEREDLPEENQEDLIDDLLLSKNLERLAIMEEKNKTKENARYCTSGMPHTITEKASDGLAAFKPPSIIPLKNFQIDSSIPATSTYKSSLNHSAGIQNNNIVKNDKTIPYKFESKNLLIQNNLRTTQENSSIQTLFTPTPSISHKETDYIFRTAPVKDTETHVITEEQQAYINKLLNSKTTIPNPLLYYSPKQFYEEKDGHLLLNIQNVNKDSKLYAKKRLITSDCDKLNYTRGPDILEKQVVLPQIMQRLVEKKNQMEKTKKYEKKLILDNGCVKEKKAKCTEPPVKLCPTVLTDDCNRERLIAFKTRQMFDYFVRTGQYF